MNERNMPRNHQSQPHPQRSGQTPPNTSAQVEASQSHSAPQSSSVPGWQTVEFPNAISIDASQRQALYTQAIARKPPASSQSSRPATPPPKSDQAAQSAEGLISLIADANQRNHELMNRIAQLEDALEQSLQALQAELDRTDGERDSTAQETADADAAQQVNYLLTQLEFAQQANQRQEILVETLTGQLQSNQDRVTELEDECNVLQQNLTAQTTQLQQCEAQCHDLQARLQRQQQYTLQFKAALDKCLEVPPPSYETEVCQDDTAQAMSGMMQTPQVPIHESAGEMGTSTDAVDAVTASEPGESAENSTPPLNDGDGTVMASLRDPAKLVESFFPKVDHIKPWSSGTSEVDPMMGAQGAAGAGSTRLAPDADVVDAMGQSTLPDLFATKFHDTLLELARPNVSASPEPERHQETVPASDESERGRASDSSHADISDSNISSLGEPDALDGFENGTSQPIPDLAVSAADQSVPSPWRSLMPPDLRIEKDSEEASRPSSMPDSNMASSPSVSPLKPSSQHSEVLLPGEPVSKPQTDTNQEKNVEVESPNTDLTAPDNATDNESEGDRPPESDPQDNLWYDLAQLIHATTDDMVRAQQASDFSMFGTDSSDPASLLEIFSKSESSEQSLVDSSAPLGFNLDKQQQEKPYETAPDPWTTAPGSYLSSPHSSEKIASIPPLSFPFSGNQSSEPRTTTHPVNDTQDVTNSLSEAVLPPPPENISSASSEHIAERQGQLSDQRLEPDEQGAGTTADPVADESHRPNAEAPSGTSNSGLSDESHTAPKRPSLSSLIFGDIPPSEPTRPLASDSGGLFSSHASQAIPPHVPSVQQPNSQNPNWPSPLLSPIDTTEKQNTEKRGTVIDLPAFLR